MLSTPLRRRDHHVQDRPHELSEHYYEEAPSRLIKKAAHTSSDDSSTKRRATVPPHILSGDYDSVGVENPAFTRIDFADEFEGGEEKLYLPDDTM